MNLNNKGFTLVELLAIILLLALITSVSTSAVVGFINTSKENSHEVLKKNIKIGAEEFFKECENKNIFGIPDPSEDPDKLTISCNIVTDGNEKKYLETNIKTLLDYGFLKSTSTEQDDDDKILKIIENPITNDNMNDCKLKITKINNNNSVWYEVITTSEESYCNLNTEE